MVTDETTDGAACADRVRSLRKALYGPTLGNKYREQIASLRAQSGDALCRAACDTQGALLKRVFDDPDLAQLALAKLARQNPHAALIFIALDLANISLMNPKLQPAAIYEQWVKDISRTKSQPVAVVLQCLERLKHVMPAER